MNSLLQHSWISKLVTLKADAQYSKATQTRLQDLNDYANTKQNSFHINSVFLFPKTFCGSQNCYILTFT